MIEFVGKYTATIDEKGRIVLPSAFKKEVGATPPVSLFLEKNLHKDCLDIHTETSMKIRVTEFEAQIEEFGEDYDDDMRQFFYENIIKVSMAANGRINIPSEYLDYAGLKKNAEFVGMGKSIRLLAVKELGKQKMTREEFLQRMKEKRQKKQDD